MAEFKTHVPVGDIFKKNLEEYMTQFPRTFSQLAARVFIRNPEKDGDCDCEDIQKHMNEIGLEACMNSRLELAETIRENAAGLLRIGKIKDKAKKHMEKDISNLLDKTFKECEGMTGKVVERKLGWAAHLAGTPQLAEFEAENLP